MIKILDIEFDDDIKMIEVMKEFNKRGLNPAIVPYHFLNMKQKQKEHFDFNQKTAQEILDEIDIELNYINLVR